MTFGNISSFLVALQPGYRNKVAAYISLLLYKDDKIPAKILLSWCNALRYLRNICSYNGRLYERLHHTLPALHHSDKELLETNSENDDKTLFIYFIAMRHLILSMSLETQNFWNKKYKIY
ncbi:CAAX protease [Streptococcus pseudopneumoniae G42]|nr:CAAX protease [Streptococcus pseudopneumoniae G42]